MVGRLLWWFGLIEMAPNERGRGAAQVLWNLPDSLWSSETTALRWAEVC